MEEHEGTKENTDDTKPRTLRRLEAAQHVLTCSKELDIAASTVDKAKAWIEECQNRWAVKAAAAVEAERAVDLIQQEGQEGQENEAVQVQPHGHNLLDLLLSQTPQDLASEGWLDSQVELQLADEEEIDEDARRLCLGRVLKSLRVPA